MSGFHVQKEADTLPYNVTDYSFFAAVAAYILANQLHRLPRPDVDRKRHWGVSSQTQGADGL